MGITVSRIVEGALEEQDVRLEKAIKSQTRAINKNAKSLNTILESMVKTMNSNTDAINELVQEIRKERDEMT